MSVTNPIESPASANPIINANIIGAENNPVESPITGESYNPDYDISCGCSASVPPGSRVTFMKFAAISMIVGGSVVFGFFKLCQHLGWM